MTSDAPRWRRRRLTFAATGVLVIAGAFLFAPLFVGHSQSQVFCTLGLSTSSVDGQLVALQDQHAAGRDDPAEQCGDIAPNGDAQMNTLGFDCKVRDARGSVVATTTPNRRDGTCGQPDH